jgi:hypothetical protein
MNDLAQLRSRSRSAVSVLVIREANHACKLAAQLVIVQARRKRYTRQIAKSFSGDDQLGNLAKISERDAALTHRFVS